jgi:hypothetical protein
MSVDKWKTFCDIASVVLVLLTFLAGAGALWTGNRINMRQEEQLRVFAIKLAEANAHAATAAQKAVEAQTDLIELTRAMAPRTLGSSYISEAELLLFAGTNVFIVFQPQDSEAESLARGIGAQLRGSGWKIIGIEPATSDVMSPTPAHIFSGVRFLTRFKLGDSDAMDSTRTRAAEIIAFHMKDLGIIANVDSPTSGSAWPSRIPNNAVLIKIGAKPQDYWMRKVAKEGMEILERNEKMLSPEARLLTEQRKRWIDQTFREEAERDRKEAEVSLTRRQKLIEDQRRFLQTRPKP